MNIQEFCNLHGIAYTWLYVKVNPNKKEPVWDNYPDGKRDYTHFKKSIDLVYQQQQYLKNNIQDIERVANQLGYTIVLAIDTYNIYQIDIDSPDYEEDFKDALQKYPYYLSCSKQLPHIFVKSKIDTKNKNKMDLEYGELLHGQWAFASLNCQVFNHDKSFDFKDNKLILNYLKRASHPKEQVQVQYVEQVSIESVMQVLDKISYDDSYDNWITVGMALKGWNPIQGFYVWQEFSKKFPKYNANDWNWNGVNKYKYDGFDTDKYNFGTLVNMIDDKPTRLLQTKKDSDDDDKLNTMMYEFNHRNVAIYFAQSKYAYDWKYCSINNVWFGIEKNIWFSCKDPPTLYDQIANVVKTGLKNKLHFLPIDESNEKLVKKLCKCILTIGNHTFRSAVVKELRSYFLYKNFAEQLDTNINLFAFNDKVYDLQTNEVRDIHPNDFISITTGYNYPIKDKKIQDEIFTHIYSMFKTQPDADYLLNILSSCLIGNNKFQEFYILTGNGGNGKSLLMSLLGGAFGNYIQTINTSSITKKQKSANDTSDWVKTKGCRILTMTEPSVTDRLQIDVIKKITGNDPIVERALYCQSVTFIPQFTPFMLANSIPDLSKLDGGIERRIKIINFPFQFKESLEQGNDLVKERILSLQDDFKNPKYYQQFILIIIDIYKTVKDHKIIQQPQSHNEATMHYINDNNLVKGFVAEYIEVTNNKSDKVWLSTLLECYNELYPEFKLKQKDFSKQIQAYLGMALCPHIRINDTNKSGFIGIKIKI